MSNQERSEQPKRKNWLRETLTQAVKELKTVPIDQLQESLTSERDNVSRRNHLIIESKKQLAEKDEQIAALRAVVEKVREIAINAYYGEYEEALVGLEKIDDLTAPSSLSPSTILDSIREEAAKQERKRCKREICAGCRGEADWNPTPVFYKGHQYIPNYGPVDDAWVHSSKWGGHRECDAAAIRSQEESRDTNSPAI